VQYPAVVDVVVEHLARGKPGGACAGFAVQLTMVAPPGWASTRRHHASKPRLPRGRCSSRPGPLHHPPCYTRPRLQGALRLHGVGKGGSKLVVFNRRAVLPCFRLQRCELLLPAGPPFARPSVASRLALAGASALRFCHAR
jgi:hypothetical protein